MSVVMQNHRPELDHNATKGECQNAALLVRKDAIASVMILMTSCGARPSSRRPDRRALAWEKCDGENEDRGGTRREVIGLLSCQVEISATDP
jgi:hypothetical protein